MASLQTGITHNQATPAHLYSDFEWVKTHEKALLEQFGETLIVVYQQQVLGSGTTREEALANAEQHVTKDESFIPLVYQLYQRHPFWRVYPLDEHGHDTH